MARPEKKNGRVCFTVTIQSIPAPDFAQWSIKEKSSDTFIPIDENVEEFKGTSHTLPHPVLVVNPKTNLDNYCFQIEIRNFIGCCKKITPGKKAASISYNLKSQINLDYFITFKLLYFIIFIFFPLQLTVINVDMQIKYYKEL